MTKYQLKGFFAVLVMLAFAMGSFASVHYPATEKAKFRTEVMSSVSHDYLVNAVCDSNAIVSDFSLISMNSQIIYLQTNKQTAIKKDHARAINFKWLNVQHYFLYKQDVEITYKRFSTYSGKSGFNEYAVLINNDTSIDWRRWNVPYKLGTPTGQVHESKLSGNEYLRLRLHGVSLIS